MKIRTSLALATLLFCSGALSQAQTQPEPSPSAQLSARLKSGEPQALLDVLALLRSRAKGLDDWDSFVRNEDDVVLYTSALTAAREYMKHPNPVEERPLWASYVIWRVYGTKEGFTNVLEEARRTRKEDQHCYLILWRSFAGQRGGRVVELCRIYIQDSRNFPGTTCRFCDAATAELQRVTHHDFGLKPLNTFLPIAEHDRAVNAARHWLAKSQTEWR